MFQAWDYSKEDGLGISKAKHIFSNTASLSSLKSQQQGKQRWGTSEIKRDLQRQDSQTYLYEPWQNPGF